MIPLFQGLKLWIFWISVDFQRLDSVQKRFQVFVGLPPAGGPAARCLAAE